MLSVLGFFLVSQFYYCTHRSSEGNSRELKRGSRQWDSFYWIKAFRWMKEVKGQSSIVSDHVHSTLSRTSIKYIDILIRKIENRNEIKMYFFIVLWNFPQKTKCFSSSGITLGDTWKIHLFSPWWIGRHSWVSLELGKKIG